MSPSPQFMFDFGSPNAYLAEKALPAIERRTGVKFEYVPVLLGGIFKATNNRSPAETLAGVKNKREFHAIETERFIKRFGVKPYTWNPFFPVNTLNLMRGLQPFAARRWSATVIGLDIPDEILRQADLVTR